jgi:hypothetical protein
MNAASVWEIARAVLLSIGGGAALLWGLSSWFGKVWASKILEKDKARYQEQLEAFKSEFENVGRRLQAQLDRGTIAYRSRLEIEVKGITDIWNVVADANQCIHTTRPEIRIGPALTETARRRAFDDRIEALRVSRESLKGLIFRYDPYLAPDLHEPLMKVVDAVSVEVINGITPEYEFESEEWRAQGKSNREAFERYAASVKKLIRNRIDLLAVYPVGNGDASGER